MLNNKMLVRLNIQVNTLTDVGITIIESKKQRLSKILFKQHLLRILSNLLGKHNKFRKIGVLRNGPYFTSMSCLQCMEP